MQVKIYIRGTVEVDLPDSVCLDGRKSGVMRLSHSEDETRSMNDAIRKHLREAAAEPERLRKDFPEPHYHSMYGGREYPPMPKEVP